MPESRSDTLRHTYHKSLEQFDYFMVAVISAVVAYIAQSVPVSLLTSPSYDIYLAAILCLMGAMFCGFKRIQRTIDCKALNARVLHELEQRGQFTAALEARPEAERILNKETGQWYTQAQIAAEIKRIGDVIPETAQRLKKSQTEAGIYYTLRNRLFLVGIVGVFIAKAFKPYLG